MKLVRKRLGVFARLMLGFALFVPALAPGRMGDASGDAKPAKAHRGYPEDWSARYTVLTGNSSSAALTAGASDPRHVYNMVRRMVAIRNARRRPRSPKPHMKIDWSVSLENGYVPAAQFPAKFRFDVTSQNCTTDYVVFGLTIAAGKPAQANVVGINNLYTPGPCTGPSVAFAYNTVTQTGGQIMTSPMLSQDGSKVAFVESTTTGSYFHVLVLPSSLPAVPAQTVLNPAKPTLCTLPTTAGCMTTVQIPGGANTLSSPWIDYNSDIAYVGTDDGRLHQIAPVFGGGAPQVDTDMTNWPVTITTGTVLTGPVVDSASGRIFIGDDKGFLSAISLKNPAQIVAAKVQIGAGPAWGPGTGIVDSPVVVNDSANPTTNQLFIFSGCSITPGIGAVVAQMPASFTSATVPLEIDIGSSDGRGGCTGNNTHSGQFDNQFWINGSTGGHMLACGVTKTGGQNPWLYRLGFNASHLLTYNGATSFRLDNQNPEECSPLTEFHDGTTDRVFLGVGSGTSGFVKSSNITTGLQNSGTCTNGAPTATCVTAPRFLAGTSGIVVDNQVSGGGTNIYFSTLTNGSVSGQNCKSSALGASANPYCAVKLTQAGLN